MKKLFNLNRNILISCSIWGNSGNFFFLKIIDFPLNWITSKVQIWKWIFLPHLTLLECDFGVPSIFDEKNNKLIRLYLTYSQSQLNWVWIQIFFFPWIKNVVCKFFMLFWWLSIVNDFRCFRPNSKTFSLR